MKIFVRERRRSDKGQQRPRYRVVGVQGGDLKIYAKRIRKCELAELAEHTGAEIIYLARGEDEAEGVKPKG
ncbi:hypothetical protein [Pseudodesulfovibrio piezophilus]|uniref:Uncharacterized protein n=1 Tax=Pseudodesulfovibrio piezophilus (strain DSM 21447 / JCM 15486 / C1TLV30) TaxID=1322246 RepID=M1WLW1_PSEP2|nr:hypothetical protein [Pseudodesulfovibrio piezophilus]CCH48550.1 conserved protein of unknown function [Pseudodesulfovibrio piezophilus C1TLV30]